MCTQALDDDTPFFCRVIRDRTGLLFFVSINLMFSNMGALEIFLKERVIFVHEKASGYYRVSAYFVAKMICDMFPGRPSPLCVCVRAYVCARACCVCVSVSPHFPLRHQREKEADSVAHTQILSPMHVQRILSRCSWGDKRMFCL